ncbi:hypothetical protein LNO88_13480 [Klebsiella pneumoniae subsp. pneumoniae]|nr:hypothetical protein [Klebsiella pneumoniae subsp. pneumoniae]
MVRAIQAQDDADWISRYQTLWARHRDGQMSTRELVTAVLSGGGSLAAGSEPDPGAGGAGDCRP